MNSRATLEALLDGLSEDRLRQLIDFARFLAEEDEQVAWQRFGQTQLARAYGPDEPDYGMLEPWVELPRPTSEIYVRAKRGTLPLPNIPLIPTDED
jgi:hypothetical protein